jgi:CoA-transferase family III
MTAKTGLPQDELPLLSASAGFQLLAGVRVLDLTSSIAGPYGTMLLADLGADVVKIERSGVGDDSRRWGPPFLEDHALWYAAVNRNKRSVDLDLRTDEGRGMLQSLVAASDVVVTSLRDGAMSRLGVAYQQVRELRSDLIHCTITGYGLTGPKSELPGYVSIKVAVFVDGCPAGRPAVASIGRRRQELPKEAKTCPKNLEERDVDCVRTWCPVRDDRRRRGPRVVLLRRHRSVDGSGVRSSSSLHES